MKDTLALALKYLEKIDGHLSTETSSSSLWANLFTLTIALLAGCIALYQVRLNVIASSRISWIENLRTNLSDYLVEVTDSITHLKDLVYQIRKHKTVNYPGNEEHYNRYFDCNSRRQKSEYKCKMYLNEEEAKHKSITTLIDQISVILNQEDINKIDISEVNDLITKIIPISKIIFKEEWSKSKKIFQK